MASKELITSTLLISYNRRGLLPIYDTLRMCGPNSPLFSAARLSISPYFFLFLKYMTDPYFLDCDMNGLFSDIPVSMHILLLRYSAKEPNVPFIYNLCPDSKGNMYWYRKSQMTVYE